jgi:hypothetical protein
MFSGFLIRVDFRFRFRFNFVVIVQRQLNVVGVLNRSAKEQIRCSLNMIAI